MSHMDSDGHHLCSVELSILDWPWSILTWTRNMTQLLVVKDVTSPWFRLELRWQSPTSHRRTSNVREWSCSLSIYYRLLFAALGSLFMFFFLSTFLGRYLKSTKKRATELGGCLPFLARCLAISFTGTKLSIQVHGGIWVFMLSVSIFCYWTKGRCGWSTFCGCVCGFFRSLAVLGGSASRTEKPLA